MTLTSGATSLLPDWSGVESRVIARRHLWQWLGLFESVAYCERVIQEHLIRKGHKLKDPPTQTARDLAACVRHSRGYFSSAADADIAVAPLLLYYGVLSMAKAIVIARGARKGLSGMASSHGFTVSTLDGSKTRSRDVVPEVLAYAATVTKHGTFTEYVEAIGIPMSFRAFDDFTKGSVLVTTQVAPVGAIEGKTITVDDLLSRHPALRGLYEHATGRPLKNFLALTSVRYSGNKGQWTTHFVRDPLCPDVRADATAAFHSLAAAQWSTNCERQFPSPFEDISTCATTSEPLPVLPLSAGFELAATTTRDAGYVVAPFDFGFLGESVQLYLLSYLLGMLVRYYPRVWLALVASEFGDALLPVVRGAVDTIRDRFPLLALAGLTSYEHEESFSTF